tara:strand:+ start:711 stop:1190 length:480 start_codon:yes stop_codon:yes gene_type:complete
MDLKKIASGLILVIGLFTFIISIFNNNLNVALIYLMGTLIFWVLYGLILNTFDVRIFSGIISASGFILAISVFFMFGLEEVPYPPGAIVFHTGGFAGALGIILFSLLPLLIIHQMNSNTLPKPQFSTNIDETSPKPELESDDWEFATEEELQSSEWDII